MKETTDSSTKQDARQGESEPTTRKLSRREFAKSSVAAGAAAVAMTGSAAAEPQAAATASAPARPSGSAAAGSENWKEGWTIPAEYYLDESHYRNDERYIAENFWLLADHVSRIPKPGDYFVFKFGLGESVIVVRGEDNEVRAFNNVCRHRGSRLCKHDDDPQWKDERLSVAQLGESGNTQYFRCPYHAWLYDLDGSLMDAYATHADFNMQENGLLPCHMRIEEGNIFLNFSQAEQPPPFDNVQTSANFTEFTQKYGVADLKVAVRHSYPIKANWKLAIENFVECYHCGPSHKNLVTTHNWDHTLTESQQKRRDAQIAEWMHLTDEQKEARGMGYGDGPLSGELNPGFVTGSLDGKAVAPLLPNIKEWTHDTNIVTTSFSTGYWQAYDDHVAVARFTPRGPDATDCEIFWLVHPDAVEGKDYDPENVMALWHITIMEDAWIVENNHAGIKSGAYRSGRYSMRESGPSGFVAWYMNEVVKA